MKYHKIEVDEQVFQFLGDHAAPFVETTPNTVLRRLLLDAKKYRALKGNYEEEVKSKSDLIPSLNNSQKKLFHPTMLCFILI
jgi:hypothetical protein